MNNQDGVDLVSGPHAGLARFDPYILRAPGGGAVRQRIRLPQIVVLALLMVAVFSAGALALGSTDDEQPTGQKTSWQEAPLPTPEWPTLRSLAPPTLRIGSAVDGRKLNTDPAYRSVLASDFNAVTAENAMKWRNLEVAPDVYDWTAVDQLIEFAQRYDQAVYGHTLVWHTDVPEWISPDWPSERIRETLREHITTVVSRYRGKVWGWDVLNEPLAEDGSLRDTIWLRKLGPSYIAEVFRWAHEADPDAVLFLNEYGVEGRTKKADALLTLVRELRAAGIPIEGVGFQSHLPWDKMPKDMAGNLARFADLGVSVAVTELDVRIELPVTEEKLERQATMYRHVLESCLAVPACVSFTVWGFTDARSWIPSYHKGYSAACLFDEEYKPKLAHSALVTTLREYNRARPS